MTQVADKWGAGDLELSVKYRFYYDKEAQFQIAVLPGVTLLTASAGFCAGWVTAFRRRTGASGSLFGDGYAINPGLRGASHHRWGESIRFPPIVRHPKCQADPARRFWEL